MNHGAATVAVFCAVLAGNAWAGACIANSGASTAALLELYTSEGCDSCPPADRWLSALVPPARTGGVIALAFHVDYWNHLGWPDRFAAPVHAERQHVLAKANGAGFVYTPEVALQGREFTRWRSGDVAAAIAAVQARPARAAIALDARVEGGELRFDAAAEIPAAADRRGAVLWVAYADSGHLTDVKSGENRGVRLAHDHVVRALSRTAAADADGRARLAAALPLPKEAGKHATLVAVVQNPASGDVLQAVALSLDGCR